MGGTNFECHALGKTADAAYDRAVKDASWEYGHGGYTGTIAEKSGYVLFTPLKGKRLPVKTTAFGWGAYVSGLDDLVERARYGKDKQALAKLINIFGARQATRMTDTYGDKWGPAVAIEVTGTNARKYKEAKGRKGTHDKLFLFCGIASC